MFCTLGNKKLLKKTCIVKQTLSGERQISAYDSSFSGVLVKITPKYFTVWKFHDFSTTKIFREISFEDYRSAKSATLTHLEAQNWTFVNFCTILRLKITKWTKFTAPKIAKTAVFALLNSTKLILHKIWVIEKFWTFHTVTSL